MDTASADTCILLLRHGETRETAERRYPSLNDLPLSERGRMQAAALARALKDVRLEAIFSSDTQRAQETAAPLINTREVTLQVLPDLAEIRFGRLGGLTFEEATQTLADIFTRWQDNPFEVALPDGEPFLDFVGRVRRIRRQLSRAWAGRTITVVTHGGVIAVWRCLEEGRPWSDFWHSIPAPASGIWLIRSEGQVRVETLRLEI
jgi:2,3-bisphosphoglycerate-dependent phosphoglycerate mutase